MQKECDIVPQSSNIVFTGEDITSAFKGKGKIGPLKKLKKPKVLFNVQATR